MVLRDVNHPQGLAWGAAPVLPPRVSRSSVPKAGSTPKMAVGCSEGGLNGVYFEGVEYLLDGDFEFKWLPVSPLDFFVDSEGLRAPSTAAELLVRFGPFQIASLRPSSASQRRILPRGINRIEQFSFLGYPFSCCLRRQPRGKLTSWGVS